MAICISKLRKTDDDDEQNKGEKGLLRRYQQGLRAPLEDREALP